MNMPTHNFHLYHKHETDYHLTRYIINNGSSNNVDL